MTDRAKLLAGPWLEKVRARAKYAEKETAVTGSVRAELTWCADELLAHLRESGICELLEAGQAMRDADPWRKKFEYSMDRAAWDAALAKLLAKVEK